MSDSSQSIPLICYGKHQDRAERMGQSFLPQVTYAAIQTSYDKDTLLNLLQTLNPTIRGVIVGGGFEANVPDIEDTVNAWNDSRSDGPDAKVISVPAGTFEAGGEEALVKFCKDAFSKAFGVQW